MDSDTRFYSFSLAFMILFSTLLQYPHPQIFDQSNSIIANSVLLQNTTFAQNGLPPNTLWYVTYNSNSVSALSQNQIYFHTTSGTYPFAVQLVPFNNVTLTPSPLSGNLNSGSTVTVDFTVPTIFKQSGLPAGANWGVLYYNFLNTSTSNTTKIFLHYGTYSYLYSNAVVNGVTYVPVPSNGFLQTGSAANTVYLALNSLPAIATSTSTSSTTSTLSTSTVPASNSTPNAITTSSTITSSPTTVSKVAAAMRKGQVEASVLEKTKTFVTVANFSDTHLSVKGSTFSDVKIGFSKALAKFNVSIADGPTPISGIAATPKNNVFQYIQINESNSDDGSSIDSSVANVTYNFTVPITWLASQGMSTGNIRLVKYLPSQNSWITLPTSYMGSNFTNYFYSAISNSLSTYAVSYTTGSGSTSTSNTLSVTVASGYLSYFFAGAFHSGGSAVTQQQTWTQDSNSLFAKVSGGGKNVNASSIGSQGPVATGTYGFNPSSLPQELVLVGIGANVIGATNAVGGNGQLFQTNTIAANTPSLTYTIPTANSFVILLFSDGGATFSVFPVLPAGCNLQQDINTLAVAEVEIATCNSVAAGTKTVSFTSQNAFKESEAIAAYVFPPYALTLNDIPTTGNIMTNGGTKFAHGTTINVIGDDPINAIAFSSAYVFNSWLVSNSVNALVATSLNANSFFTVVGNTVLTATFNGLLLKASPNPPQISNTIIDVGQYSTINTIISNGIPPYLGNWIWSVPGTNVLTAGSNSNTILANILVGSTANSVLQVNAYASTNIVFSFNSVNYNANILGTNTVYGGWAFTGNYYDSATNQVNPSSITLTINPAFLSSQFTASNVLVDSGQYVTLTSATAGGTSTFTYNFLVNNVVAQTTNQLLTGCTLASNTFTFQVPSSWGTGSFTANLFNKDLATTPVTVTNTLIFGVNTALGVPSIAPSAGQANVVGDSVAFIATVPGGGVGTGPYTYNYQLTNSITNALVSNQLWTGVASTTNTFTYTFVSGDGGQTERANVIVTDSATTKMSTNSIFSGTITISASSCTISLSNSLINFGQVNPGSGSAVGNLVVDTNSGSVASYLYVYGSNWVGSPTTDNFFVANTLWNGASVGAGIGNALAISAFGSNTAILLPAASSNNIFFGVNIPVGQVADSAYSQNIAIFNVC